MLFTLPCSLSGCQCAIHSQSDLSGSDFLVELAIQVKDGRHHCQPQDSRPCGAVGGAAPTVESSLAMPDLSASAWR